MRRTIEELPGDLDATYERILKEISPVNRVYTHRLLQCLTVAVRPLVVEELAEVLAIEFDGERGIPKLNEGFRWADQEQAVLSACSSLIAIVKYSDSRRRVQFSHFSVKEFLTSDRIATSELNSLRYHHIQLESAHAVMARVCLGVLFRLDDSMDKETIQSYPLGKYVGKYFYDHAEAGNVLSRISDGVDTLFDPDKPHLKILTWLSDGDANANPKPFDFNIDPGSEDDSSSEQSSSDQSSSERSFPKYIPWFPHWFYAAVCRGTLLKHLILKHAHDLDASDVYGQTALHIAAFASNFESTQMLIEHTANINARDNRGCTPLHYAVVNGKPDSKLDLFPCVQLLLERGADANTQNNRGTTPLHLAASNSKINEKIIQLLIENVTNINLRNVQGQTALHNAALRGDTDIMSIILNHGADVDAQDNNGSTPLYRAIYKSELSAAELLLRHGANIDLQNNKRQAPLHLASRRGHLNIMRLLLEKGANVDTLDDNGSTPLHLVISDWRLPAAELLLEHGANIGLQNNKLQTVLHLASQRGHLDIMRLLLGKGANVDAPDSDGSTPLHLAISHANSRNLEDVVGLLLEHGANINMRNGQGQTALHKASLRSYPNIILLILNRGADVDAQDNDGSTPLHLFISKVSRDFEEPGPFEVFESLEVLGPFEEIEPIPVPELFLPEVSEPIQVIEPIPVLEPFEDSESIREVIILLLEHGASVHRENTRGETPFQAAGARGLQEITWLFSMHIQGEGASLFSSTYVDLVLSHVNF